MAYEALGLLPGGRGVGGEAADFIGAHPLPHPSPVKGEGLRLINPFG
jgi:hypothetical protein